MKLSRRCVPAFLTALLLLGGGLFTPGCATSEGLKPAEASTLSLEYVTSIEGFKKDAIFDGVELWIAENFKSSKAVIDLKNKEQGIIIGNGVLLDIIISDGIATVPVQLAFKMKVEVKDEKIRLWFSNYQITVRQSASLYKMEADQANERFKKFGDQIAAYIKSAKEKQF